MQQSRYDKRFACFWLGLLFNLSAVHANDTLDIVSWGGAYEQSQRAAYFEPFAEQNDVEINVEKYDGGIEALRQQIASGKTNWDLIDLEISDNMLACELGLLEEIDHAILPPAEDGTDAESDFAKGTLTPCGVPQIISATVLAYNTAAFPGEKPSTIADLFNIEKFPGPRGLQKKPIANLEWALLSYGVPLEDLYSLLSTERGLKLAFAKLDTIKSLIQWWTAGSDAPQMLASGEVVMASGYNGRLFNAAKVDGQPIEIIWDGQLQDYGTWGIVKGTPNMKVALEFIRFATSTERLAEQTKYIAYGPARRSSEKFVWRHTQSGVDIRPHLPTYPANAGRAIRKDQIWYAKTRKRLNDRFARWIDE